jgi:hypothetical protein
VVAVRLFCETCSREVGSTHRVPEPQWLHKVTLLREHSANPILNYYQPQKGVQKMPNKKVVTSKTKGKVIPGKAKAAAVKETPAERKKRELAEERAMSKSKARK